MLGFSGNYCSKLFNQNHFFKMFFTIVLTLMLCLAPLWVCVAGDLDFSGFEVDYGEILSYSPSELEYGQVYTAKNVTYQGEGVFDITLYVKLRDFVLPADQGGGSCRPLEPSSWVVFEYTLGDQFSLKSGLPSSAPGDIQMVSGVITWTVNESEINDFVQVSFSIELKDSWAVNTFYYTDKGTTVRFTPVEDNPHYYTKMDVWQSAFTIPGFNWNNGNNGFKNIIITDNILGITFALTLDANVQINGTTYKWSSDNPENSPTNSWGCYAQQDSKKKTYHFWIKSDPSNNGLGLSTGTLVYDVDVTQAGGNSDIIPGDKTIHYTEAHPNPSFVWEQKRVVDDLPNKGYILITREKLIQYSINYVLNGGDNADDNPTSYSEIDLPLDIKDPTKAGSIFLGWYVAHAIDGSLISTNTMHSIPVGTTGDVTLIAIWEPIYAINYVLNGGDNAYGNPTSYIVEDLPLLIKDPTKDDAIFLGWYVAHAIDGSLISTNTMHSIPIDTEGDITLIATWQSIYSITYVLSDGVNDVDNPDTYSIGDLPLGIKDPTKVDSIFLGWSVEYVNGTHVPIYLTDYNIPEGTEGNVTFTAHWATANQNPPYSITYVLSEGGVNDPNNPQEYHETDPPTSISDPSRNGYTFVGWTIVRADDPDNPEEATGSYTIPSGTKGDLVLIARWNAVYSIVYVLGEDGVNGPGNPGEYHENELPITINDPSRVDYDFAGWTVVYSDYTAEFVNSHYEIPVKTTGDLTLIAVWTPNKVVQVFSISYELNGGSMGLVVNPDSYVDSDLPLSIADPFRDGFVFLGWHVVHTKDGSLVSTEPLHIIPVNTEGDLVLIAIWDPSYHIKYVLNGGVNPLGNPSVYAAGNIPLEIWDPSKENHVFLGWTIVYANGDIEESNNAPQFFTIGPHFITLESVVGDLTFIANWDFSYSITYVLGENGVNDVDNPTSYTVEDEFFIKDPIRTGFNFLGWTVVYANGTINLFDSGDKCFIELGTTGNLILVARWDDNKSEYKIIYELNGGKHGNNTPNFLYDDSILPLLIEDPVREGYKFVQWTGGYVNNGNKVVHQASNGPYIIPEGTKGDLVLIANWEIAYSIIYMLNDGVNANNNPLSYSSSDLSLRINNPSKSGFTFSGWTVAYANGTTEGTVPLYNYRIPVGTFGTIVLTAHWMESDVVAYYTVTYEGNGFTGGVVPVDNNSPYIENSLVRVLDPGSLGKDEHIFSGWATSAFAVESSFRVGETFTILHDTVLYAVWEQSTPTPVPSSTPSSPSPSATVNASTPTPIPTSSTITATPKPTATTTSTPTPATSTAFPDTSNDNRLPSNEKETLPAWALTNLVLSVLGIILVIAIFVYVLLHDDKKKQKEEREQENLTGSIEENNTQKEDKRDVKQKHHSDFWLAMALAMAIVGIIVFLLTEDMTRPMVIVDNWTIVDAIIFIIEIISITFVFKHKKNKPKNTAKENKPSTSQQHPL